MPATLGAGRRRGHRAEPRRRGLRLVPRGGARRAGPPRRAHRRGATDLDLHQGEFDVDERAIAVGARVLAAAALIALVLITACCISRPGGRRAGVRRVRVRVAGPVYGRPDRRWSRTPFAGQVQWKETPLATGDHVLPRLCRGALALTACGGSSGSDQARRSGSGSAARRPRATSRSAWPTTSVAAATSRSTTPAAAGLDKAKTDSASRPRRPRPRRRDRLRQGGAPARRWPGRLQPGHRGRLRLRRGRRQGRHGVPRHPLRDHRRPASTGHEHHQPACSPRSRARSSSASPRR